MKKIAIVLLVLLSSCGSDDPTSMNNIFRRERKESTTKIVRHNQPVKQNTKNGGIDYNDGVSYWYVVYSTGNYNINRFVKQNQDGFSLKQFKKETDKNAFVQFICETTKETYELNN